MKLLSSTKQEWLRLLAFPFKAYIVIAVFFYYHWRDQSLGTVGMVRYVYLNDGQTLFSIGYLTSFLALIIINLIQLLTKNRKGLTWNFIFAIIGLVCGLALFPPTVK